MVLRLAEALDVPLRQHNALLLAAGYAPAWRQTDLGSPELAQVASAVRYMLAQQEPFPAVAVDRHWNLLEANGGAVRLVEFLVGPLPPGTPVNLADALVAPDVLRPFLVNWAEVVRYFVRSVEADAAADGSEDTERPARPAARLQGRALRMKAAGDGEGAGARCCPCISARAKTSLALFTTIATLGIPQDVTAQELRIESFFPMDAETETVLRAWVPKRRGRIGARGTLSR